MRCGRALARGAGAALVVVLVSATPRATAAQQAPVSASSERVQWARITYLSGGTVYVDAGTRAGLREGSPLEVVRAGEVIAQLAVTYVSSTRSACSVVSARAEVAVGDSVRFTGTGNAAPVAAAGDSAAAARQVASARRAPPSIRGRVGLRYLAVDPGGGAASWSQPAFDLRLDGHQVGGTPLGVTVDVRAYRERGRDAGGGSTASTRVYQGNLEWNASGSPLHVAAGRQLLPALSGVGIFDGMSVELRGNRWTGGVMGGTQPDARSFGYSSLVREYGAWVQAHAASSSAGAWSITLGGIGSYDQGEIDREFAWMQAMWTSRRVTLLATQEVDVNRGWKEEVEGSGTTPTSTFALLRVSPVDAVSIHAGYDNRRSVRLYRDFVDPETEFDDAFRQGGWTGVTLSLGPHVRASADARLSRGAEAGDARSWTGSLGVHRLTMLGLGAQVRTTSYTGDGGDGSLLAGSVEMNPWSRFRLQGSAGSRRDVRAVASLTEQQLSWYGLDGDVGLGRSTYLLLSAYQERGDVGQSRQVYVALSWRF